VTIRRVSALFVAVITVGLSIATASVAWAGVGTATYPPAVQGDDTAVEGTKVGSSVSGTLSDNSSGGLGGGLPHTGFEAGLMWTAIALVVLGLALLVVSRRRRHAS
jgi:LPXTG-motif cell wall-anchored protein